MNTIVDMHKVRVAAGVLAVVVAFGQAAFAGDANSPTERARRDRETLRAQVDKLPKELIAEPAVKDKRFTWELALKERAEHERKLHESEPWQALHRCGHDAKKE